ncbi:CRISPR-associated endonuclease Cas2 [Nostoc sp.]|uniref:CRISPR-associated endonuclease Cas2 n=1 Tax=Nostoc sp. TaxID=1180 RepID=UPI002FF60F74
MTANAAFWSVGCAKFSPNVQDHQRRRNTPRRRDADSSATVGLERSLEDCDGQLVPVEYKKGKMAQHLNDHFQLCAAALCIEECTGRCLAYGEIFYHANHRRQTVAFTPQLQQMTVFECFLTTIQFATLQTKIEKLVKPEEDLVRLYVLDAGAIKRTITYGSEIPRQEQTIVL